MNAETIEKARKGDKRVSAPKRTLAGCPHLL